MAKLQSGTTIYGNANVQTFLTVGTYVSAAGNVYGNYFIGNGALLTGITTSAGSAILNGNSNVSIAAANANITLSVSTVGNVVVVTPTGISVSGTIAANGNITGGNVLTAGLISASGNVYANSIISAGGSGGNITGANLISANIFSAAGNVYAGNVTATGNVQGNYILGNGALLTGVTTSSSTIFNGNSNVAIPSANANVTVSVSTVGNVAVFTPTGLNVTGIVSATGNIIGGNIVSGGGTGGNITGANIISGNTFNAVTVSATGNVTGNFFIGNGSQLTGIITSVSNVVNGASNLNIAAANANVTISVSTVGNVAVFTPTGISVLGTVNANGNITGGNLLTSGFVSSTGNIISTANIIQSGTGNINGYNGYFGNNLTVIGTFQSTSNITANGAGIFYGNTVTGNGALYAGEPGFTPLGSNVVVQFSGNVNAYSQVNFQNINSGSLASTDLILTANNGNDTSYYADFGITSNNHSDSAFFGDSSSKNDVYLYAVANNVAGPSSTSGPGNLILGSTNGQIKLFVGNTAQANVIQQISSIGVAITGVVSATGNAIAGNILTAGLISATGNISANNFVTTGSSGNITGANIITANTFNAVTVSATGNITGSYIFGNGAFLTGISGGGGGGGSNIANGTSNVNIATADGNITAGVSGVGNVVVITSTGLSVTGNIVANTFVSSGSGGGISAPGNVIGGNILTSGYISATGNILGNYFIGDGSQLTGVISTATGISNGLSNITIATANANVTVSVSTVGNVAIFTPSGIDITGNISASGNIVAGGVRSTSSASPPANPTTGDFWYNTSTNVQYRFTFDGTNYYWIDDFGATVATEPLFTGPILFNDVSTQTNGKKGVFALKNNQANVAGIANSKQLQVIVNGAVQTPFVKTWVWPSWCIVDSFRGFKVTTLGYSSPANSVVLYRPPAKGTQVSITQVNTATDSQLRRYPFSATTIAISDN